MTEVIVKILVGLLAMQQVKQGRLSAFLFLQPEVFGNTT